MTKKKESKLKNWFKQKAAMFVLATANVEKDLLSQKDPDGADVSHTLNVSQGTLADDLMRGVLSEQVQELRWRMYTTISESEKYIRKYKGKDKNGVPQFEEVYLTPEVVKDMLSKIKLDTTDSYPLELSVNNMSITISQKDVIGDIKLDGETKKIKNKDGEEITTHGSIKGDDLILKQEKPIKVYRESLVKFELEEYAVKFHVRTISDDEKLLEFIFSKYPDEFNKRSVLFIAELKRAMNNPRNSILDIKEVGFISYKTLGAKDFLEYSYEITSFDKIIEFEGTYIVKYRAKPIVNGVSIVEKYSGGKLEEKYKSKEARKTNI